MILVAGATGELGSRVVRRLRERGEEVRALVRAGRASPELEAVGAEVVTGDLREPASLRDACAGVDVVVSGVTAIARMLAGEKTSFDEVDRRGNEALVSAAEAAGAKRFVFVSYAGLERSGDHPLARAKRAVEERLRTSPLQAVIVRPDMFHEIWLSPLSQLDWEHDRLNVLGRGDTPARYVSVDDVAALVAAVAVEDDPPAVVEFGGPEALTRNEVCAAIEREAGRPMKRRHLPRPVLAALSRALTPVRPALATTFGLGLAADRNAPRWDDAPLRERGITPRSASDYLREHVR